MADLRDAVATVLDRCLGVGSGENALVVVDPGTRAIGESLRDAAAERGAEAVLVIMDERATDGTEPPPPIAAALGASDLYIAATTRSLSHTFARKNATDAGARGATMPGVTAEMLGRVMAVEFDTMARRSRAVAELLTAGSLARITCPRGTEATIDLTGRAGIADDGDLTSPGAFGNLPCGEAFIAPLGGEGRIVAASLASLGLSDEPAVLTLKGGRLVAAAGGLGPEYLRRLSAHGELGTNLAELGVGTNDQARLTGNVLEDEKILGTIHVAFGASAAIGGTVSVPIHLDAVVTEPSLTVDGVAVLDAGHFVLDEPPD
jgi:leucyl aminopeptidase (aminopeptidase T)